MPKQETIHLNKLENVYQCFSNILETVFIISDISVKNNITTSIFYIQRKYNIIRKIIYHVINILSTEAELFAIKYGINQATQLQDVT